MLLDYRSLDQCVTLVIRLLLKEKINLLLKPDVGLPHLVLEVTWQLERCVVTVNLLLAFIWSQLGYLIWELVEHICPEEIL